MLPQVQLIGPLTRSTTQRGGGECLIVPHCPPGKYGLPSNMPALIKPGLWF